MNKSVEAELNIEGLSEHNFDKVWNAIEMLVRDCKDKGMILESSRLKMHVEGNNSWSKIFDERIEDMKRRLKQIVDILNGICQSDEFKDLTPEVKYEYEVGLIKLLQVQDLLA